MRKLTLLILTVFILQSLSSCTSHQYDQLRNEKSKTGVSSRIVDGSLVVQVQQYQFVPDTAKVMIEVRKMAKQAAQERGLKVSNFDITTERNKVLGITSAIAIGDIEE